MEQMGTKQAAEIWGCSQQTVRNWCNQGRIEGAEQDNKGSPWRIPIDAKPPKK